MKNVNYEFTGATLNFKKGSHSFSMEVKRANGNAEYVVFITHDVDMASLGEENITLKYKCVCLNCKTEHSAIHFVGKKWIKHWDVNHRIGKDYPLLNE